MTKEYSVKKQFIDYEEYCHPKVKNLEVMSTLGHFKPTRHSYKTPTSSNHIILPPKNT